MSERIKTEGAVQKRTTGTITEGIDMALADYRLCDKCGNKTFYDAGLNYEYSTRDNPIPEEEQIRNSHGVKLYQLGDWAVLCRECAKTHRCVIEPLGGGV